LKKVKPLSFNQKLRSSAKRKSQFENRSNWSGCVLFVIPYPKWRRSVLIMSLHMLQLFL